MARYWTTLVGLLLIAFSTAGTARGTVGKREVIFESQVRPLLATYCYECHGPDEQEAGLRLDSAEAISKGSENGPILVSGKPDESALIHAVRHEGDVEMPPDSKLRPDQIEVLVQWVRDGAYWPKSEVTIVSQPNRGDGPLFSDQQKAFWGFQPISDSEVPAAEDTTWSRSPIDRFVLVAQQSAGITSAAPADPRRLLRRTYATKSLVTDDGASYTRRQSGNLV